MRAKEVSSAFTTEKVSETRDFYIKYLGARLTFDCGWYINLQFGNDSATLQFMSPQKPEHKLSKACGLIYNFSVDDVDKEYDRVTKDGLTIGTPLNDAPWGDRYFIVIDPIGIALYFYKQIEPTPEFKQYIKESNEQ